MKQYARNAGYEKPEQAGEHGIGAVFQHGLGRGYRNAIVVKRRCITTDDTANLLPGILKVAPMQRVRHGTAMLRQATNGQGEIQHHSLNQQVLPVPQPPAQPLGCRQYGYHSDEQGQEPENHRSCHSLR